MIKTKDKIKELHKKKNEIQAEIDSLIDDCSHQIEDYHGDARCKECGSYFGYYCKESLDHVCHYEEDVIEKDDQYLIELLDKSFVVLETPDAGCWDMCFFCGNPSERK